MTLGPIICILYYREPVGKTMDYELVPWFVHRFDKQMVYGSSAHFSKETTKTSL